MTDTSENLVPPFPPGSNGGYGPKDAKPKAVARGLAKYARDETDEGKFLVELWLAIASDPLRRDADRLRASELLADRGFGKAANFSPQEGDPLGLEDLQESADEFRRSIIRLAAPRGAGEDVEAGGGAPPD